MQLGAVGRAADIARSGERGRCRGPEPGRIGAGAAA